MLIHFIILKYKFNPNSKKLYHHPYYDFINWFIIKILHYGQIDLEYFVYYQLDRLDCYLHYFVK